MAYPHQLSVLRNAKYPLPGLATIKTQILKRSINYKENIKMHKK